MVPTLKNTAFTSLVTYQILWSDHLTPQASNIYLVDLQNLCRGTAMPFITMFCITALHFVSVISELLVFMQNMSRYLLEAA